MAIRIKKVPTPPKESLVEIAETHGDTLLYSFSTTVVWGGKRTPAVAVFSPKRMREILKKDPNASITVYLITED